MSDLKATLDKLLDSTARELLRRVESKEASPADIMAAIRLLKDNGVDMAALKGTPLLKLASSLPFNEDEQLKATGT